MLLCCKQQAGSPGVSDPVPGGQKGGSTVSVDDCVQSEVDWPGTGALPPSLALTYKEKSFPPLETNQNE